MRTSKPSVLVVDPDPQVRKMLAVTLSASQFKVIEAETAPEALRLAGLYQPDAMILETALTGEAAGGKQARSVNGLEVIRAIRQWSRLPVLALSESDEPDHIVECLRQGANDFVSKPFNMEILMARLEVMLRDRCVQEAGNSELHCGDIVVTLTRHDASLAGKPLELSPREYELLSYFIRNKGKLLTHRQILKTLWGDAHTHDRQYLRVYIMQLRHKIEPDPQQPHYIITEAGVGYRMDEPEPLPDLSVA